MKNRTELLPPGSMVYLEGWTVPLGIIGVCQFMTPQNTNQRVYFDYSAAPYPRGLEKGNVYYFNHENIQQVLSTGFQSPAFTSYLYNFAQKLANEQGTFLYGRL